MNTSELMFNLTSEDVIRQLPKQSIEDFTRSACQQINHHVIKIGIIIIILYVIICWGKWWFFQHWFKRLPDHSRIYWTLENRIYWDTFITQKLLKFTIGYITLVVFLFWRGG